MGAWRITLFFLAFGLGWVALSDHLLLAWVSDGALRDQLQSVKGMVYVGVSALLVYALVRSAERTQAKLQAQTQLEHDHLAQVVCVSPAVIYSLRAVHRDPQPLTWHLELVGKNMERLSGFTTEQWQNTPNLWLDRVHPGDVAQVIAAQRRLMATGKLSHGYRFVHPDGAVRWIHDDVVLLRDAAGRPQQITGAWLDITNQTLAQAAMVDSEQRYTQLFKSNPTPIWVFDTQSLRFLSVNDAAIEKYGYTEAEFLGMTINDIRPERELARLHAHLAEPSGVRGTTDSVSTGEWVHRKKDGTEFWVSVMDHNVAFGGRPARLVSAHDITERHRAQESLIVEMFQSSREGMFITDALGHFASVNPSFTRITGYGLDELRGQTPAVLRSHKHDKAFYQAIMTGVSRHGRWEGEVWSRRQNGEVQPDWLTLSAITDAQQHVVQYLGVLADAASRQDAELRIQRLANYDSLTNLPNRGLLNDRARIALVTAASEHSHVVVMQANVDHFKTINELFGHDMGDAVLAAVAQRLEACLKPIDTVSRLGADDFIILLPGTDALVAGPVALRLLNAVKAPLLLNGQVLRITASIGIAEFPDNGQDWTQLTQAAETAVSQAKRDGRDTVSHFSPALHQQLQETMVVERDLQHALARQQLVVHYQPQVNANTQRVVGVEALVRWQHPEWGLVAPGRFIGVAEKTGLIRPIGDWVLQQALTDAAHWQAAGLALVPVAVNLSMAQFRHEGLLDTVAQALARSGLPPSMLELELTESVAMEDSEFTITTINRLKQLGVQLSIDDFGTGYSSLSYLKRFSVDKLKIDKSFVDGLNHDPDDEAIVSAVIQLAKSLGLKTIAEGVETPDQALFLRAKGCDQFQGYLFSRPVPASDMARLLGQGLLPFLPTAA